MNYGFFALMFRMKYINRWSLMRCNISENLSEHSLEVAFLANALANIGNTCFGKSYNAEKIALKAMYHDAAEVMTGDLPTPVKYYDGTIRQAYAAVEKCAVEKILSLLPNELLPCYKEAFSPDGEEKAIIKAADKLCAYIKCVNEEKSGNIEFSHAAKASRQALEGCRCEELDYFIKNFLNSFFDPLDNISL